MRDRLLRVKRTSSESSASSLLWRSRGQLEREPRTNSDELSSSAEPDGDESVSVDSVIGSARPPVPDRDGVSPVRALIWAVWRIRWRGELRREDSTPPTSLSCSFRAITCNETPF